jgi:hypothetical protein
MKPDGIHRMQLAADFLDQLGNVLASLGAALFYQSFGPFRRIRSLPQI